MKNEQRRRYFECFESRDQMMRQFEVDPESQEGQNFPADEDILFAAYTYADYDGTAFVVFRKGDDLYEVNGSHCSCYGLEGQWCPELTSPEALGIRTSPMLHWCSDYTPEFAYLTEAFRELFPVVTLKD